MASISKHAASQHGWPLRGSRKLPTIGKAPGAQAQLGQMYESHNQYPGAIVDKAYDIPMRQGHIGAVERRWP
eukprot:scaffold36151_cov23-Tisochrysis_lutea.AAC.1